jgi:predicted metal-dependent phosphoesterase TrpH
MSNNSTPEELAAWQRRLASQANNRAWRLSEAPSRSPEEDEEMLHAAHAAIYFWKIVGNANNRAHAAQLLAHTYALLKLARPAKHYLAQATPTFLNGGAAPWEVAIAHAVAAGVASVCAEHENHKMHYTEAVRLIAALEDPEDREIINATLNVVPRFVGAGNAG